MQVSLCDLVLFICENDIVRSCKR